MELTFCIITFNSTSTLTAVLKRLLSQNMIPNILIYDNGSTDGTVEMVNAQIKNRFFGKSKIEIVEDNHLLGGRLRNITHCRYMISQKVKTKYIMFIDSDVLIPAFGVEKLMKEMKNPKLGMIGIRYEPMADHVKMGAALIRSDLAKQASWKANPKCECKYLKKELEEKGFITKYHKDLQATHLKILTGG